MATDKTEKLEQITAATFGTVWSGKGESRVESEYVLPDYKEAAQRLLRVDVDPCVTEKRLYRKGQEIVCEIEGVAFIHVLYVPEGENGEKTALSFDAKEPFYSAFRAAVPEDELPDPEGAVVLCEGTGENVNARLLGPRRLAVRCDVALSLSLRGNRRFEMLGEEQPGDVKTRILEAGNTVLAGVSRWDFRLAETIRLPASYLPIREMTDLNVVMFASRVQCENGAVNFTGHLVVNAAYAPEGEPGVISFCQPFEFEKNVGDGAARPDDLCEVTLIPGGLQVSVEMNEGGENKDLVLDVSYVAEVRLYRAAPIRYASDLFSLKSETETRSSEHTLREMISVQDFAREVRCEMPLRHAPFLRAEDLRAVLRFKNSYREGEDLVVEAALVLKYLAVAENGALSAAEDTAEIRFELPQTVALAGDDAQVEIDGGISDAELALTGDLLRARVGVFGRVALYREEKITCLSEALRTADLKKDLRGLIFYYPDENETLWDVCKRFHADVERVQADNAGSESRALRILVN